MLPRYFAVTPPRHCEVLRTAIYNVAIHEAVQQSETLERAARPSGLPRAFDPRNDELGRNRKNRGKCVRDRDGATQESEETGKSGKEKKTGRGKKGWRRREGKPGVIQTPENLLRYPQIT
ncbi:MAG: hypothetical protein LBO79_05950, partial [Zoogloeaceae bacterium]|nr:hypothetical protein [Zoogloeaceae bacterium]